MELSVPARPPGFRSKAILARAIRVAALKRLTERTVMPAPEVVAERQRLRHEYSDANFRFDD